MRIVVISATSVLARHCISLWAAQDDHSFILVGRDETRIGQTAADLAIRFPKSTFEVESLNFQDSSAIDNLVARVSVRRIDLVLIAQGSATIQSSASNDLAYLKAELELNAISVAAFTEGFVQNALRSNLGTIGVIGSVAGDRGRAYNYAYGSAKALVEVFLQGLQQRVANTGVAVCLIKPGPTATPMTSAHRGRFADPSAVARVIIRGLAKQKRVIYAPIIWKYIMFIVRLIPFGIFKRLRF